MPEQFTESELFKMYLLKLKYETEQLKSAFEDLIPKLDKEISYLEWELKWYNLWLFFLPESWRRRIYAYFTKGKEK